MRNQNISTECKVLTTQWISFLICVSKNVVFKVGEVRSGTSAEYESTKDNCK